MRKVFESTKDKISKCWLKPKHEHIHTNDNSLYYHVIGITIPAIITIRDNHIGRVTILKLITSWIILVHLRNLEDGLLSPYTDTIYCSHSLRPAAITIDKKNKGSLHLIPTASMCCLSRGPTVKERKIASCWLVSVQQLADGRFWVMAGFGWRKKEEGGEMVRKSC